MGLGLGLELELGLGLEGLVAPWLDRQHDPEHLHAHVGRVRVLPHLEVAERVAHFERDL